VLTISTASNKISGVTITNLIGQCLFTQAYQVGKIQLDISGLPAGAYFAKINGSDGYAEVRRFVKE
jgi:hypothetical protein